MAGKNPFLLEDLEVEEMSFVDRGANQHAKILITKKSGKNECDKMEKTERHNLVKTIARYLNAEDLIKKSDNLEDDDVPDKNLETMQKSLEDVTKANAILMAVTKSDRVINTAMRDINKAADVAGVDSVLTKAKADIAEITKDLDDQNTIKDINGQVVDVLEETAKAKKGDMESQGDKEKMNQARDKMPPAMQKAFDAMSAEDQSAVVKAMGDGTGTEDPVAKVLKSLTETNENLVAQVADLTKNQDIAKAKDEFKDLDGFVQMDKFIEDVLALRKVNKSAADSMVEQTRALAKQAREGGLFKVIGKNGDADGSVDEKLTKAIQKYRQENPSCTSDEVAMAKVLEADPKLYAEYNQEHMNQAG